LPKSAQFLNVIESIFGGMARRVIHNSDDQSVEKAVTAIDRYFQERNEHFLNYPKKAGKKLWGNETVISEFAEYRITAKIQNGDEIGVLLQEVARHTFYRLPNCSLQ